MPAPYPPRMSTDPTLFNRAIDGVLGPLNRAMDGVAQGYDGNAGLQLASALASVTFPLIAIPHVLLSGRAKDAAARRAAAYDEALRRELAGKAPLEYLESERFIDGVRAGFAASLATEQTRKIRMYAKFVRGEATGVLSASLPARTLIAALADLTLEELWVAQQLLDFQGGAGYDPYADESAIPQTQDVLNRVGAQLSGTLPFHLQRLLRSGFVAYTAGYGGAWYYATVAFAEAARLCQEVEREDAELGDSLAAHPPATSTSAD